jgi:hypothetical protein
MADQDPTAGAPGPRSTTSRLAHDLRAIREKRGVSLDEVQRDTRMPGDILGRFEAGDLIGDPHYNEVYLRNLLRSYAQALDLSPQEVVTAYEHAKDDSYDGSLRRRYLEEGAAKPEAPTPPASEAPPQEAPPPTKGKPEVPSKKPPPAATGGKAPAVAALSSPQKKKEDVEETPSSSRPATTRPKRRVSSASAASKPIEKSWGLVIGGVVAALVVIALVLWFLFRDPGPEPELAAVPAPADTTEAAAEPDTASAPEPVQTTAAPQFQTPVELTVVANEEPLEEFRVRVDDDVRTPYWLEPGTQQTFTAQQEVVVWGELSVDESGGGDYDGATLRLQGLDWTPPDGRIVRINQQTGQALLDSLARTANPAPTG